MGHSTVPRVQDLNLDHADFIVRHGVGQWADLHVDHLFDEGFVPVCSLALAQSLHAPEYLLKVQFLHSMMRPDGWRTWLGAVRLAEAQPTRNVTLANAALCLQAAADGLGVAIAQAAYVRDELASGCLVCPFPQEVRTEFGYYLLCDPARAHIQPLQLFREWLLSVAH